VPRSRLETTIQIREETFSGDRPSCPLRCKCRLHRHGSYSRYDVTARAQGTFQVQRFLCPHCGHTVSVLPANRLPYRPIQVDRLQTDFDQRAEIHCGLDPPPDLIEASCLHRAWKRLQTRVVRLKDRFGQLLPAGINTAQHLWKQVRWRLHSAESILRFLAQPFHTSLLADYRCLQPPRR